MSPESRQSAFYCHWSSMKLEKVRRGSDVTGGLLWRIVGMLFISVSCDCVDDLVSTWGLELASRFQKALFHPNSQYLRFLWTLSDVWGSLYNVTLLSYKLTVKSTVKLTLAGLEPFGQQQTIIYDHQSTKPRTNDLPTNKKTQSTAQVHCDMQLYISLMTKSDLYSFKLTLLSFLT